MDFKVEIIRERFLAVMCGAAIVIGVGLYVFLYRPLIVRLGGSSMECRAIEKEALDMREAIAVLKTKEKKKGLIAEEEVSGAVEELTREGKSMGVNFASITQKDLTISEEEYIECPIEIDAEAGYKALGLFMGSLDNLEKSLVTVERVSMKPDSENPAKLNARMLINIYLSK